MSEEVKGAEASAEADELPEVADGNDVIVLDATKEERGKRPDVSDDSPAVTFLNDSNHVGGADGTRTRGLRRDRPAL